MQPTTFMLLLLGIRVVAALSMYGLHRRLRSKGTAILSVGLAVYALAAAVAFAIGDLTLETPLSTALLVAAGITMLAGVIRHFTHLNVRIITGVAVAAAATAFAGVLLSIPGQSELGLLVFIIAAIVLLFSIRPWFVDTAGMASFVGAIALSSFSVGAHAVQTFAPALLGEHQLQVIQLVSSAWLGLYLLSLEFNVSYVALTREQDRYKTLFNASGDSIFVADLDGNILDANDAATEKLGYTREQLRSMTVAQVDCPASAAQIAERIAAIHTRGSAVFESEHVCADGTLLPVEVNARQTHWHGKPATLGVCRDISERKRSEETITQMAYYDALTGLANRRLATDRLNQAIAHANRTSDQVALLFLDLDQFKSVNDTLGHTVGDGLLIAVGDRLAQLTRESDTVARLGGDEFMLIIMGLESRDAVTTVAWKVLDALREPFIVDGHDIHITASMGISVFTRGAESAVDLLRDADIAMYRAKDRGRNTYQFHDPALNQVAAERFQLKRDLRSALESNQLHLVFQPQVRVADLRVVGAEALLRWTHPVRGPISPAHFVPLAEESALIGEIGRWVMRRSCVQARRWHDLGRTDLRLAVNVSAQQFTAIGFVDEVAAILEETCLPAHSLEIEITESIAMRHSDVIGDVFRSLKALGVRVAIDDFGTGYSSLERLGTFPIHTLKVARPFIESVTDPDSRAAIARTIIVLASSLGLNVVAEGVETEEQLEFLRELGCPEMQGFLYSPGVPAEEFVELLDRDAPGLRV